MASAGGSRRSPSRSSCRTVDGEEAIAELTQRLATELEHGSRSGRRNGTCSSRSGKPTGNDDEDSDRLPICLGPRRRGAVARASARSNAPGSRPRGVDPRSLSMTLTHQLAGGEDVKLVGRAVGVPANGSVAPVAFGPLAATGIRVALRDYEPDVVHLHEPLDPEPLAAGAPQHQGADGRHVPCSTRGEPRVQRVPSDP